MPTNSLAAAALALLAALPAAAELSQPSLAAAFQRVRPAIALVEYSIEAINERTGDITKRDSNALGLIVSPEGLVMTHGHMAVENAKPFNIRVTLGPGAGEREYEATLLEKPQDINIVFLQIKSSAALNLPFVRFAPGRRLGIGEPVALFGLLGETLDFSAALEESRIGAILERPRTTYCLDENVRFGFIGGPVADAAGNLVGVVGFDLSRTEGGELYTRSGHPLVFQADLFRRYIEDPPSEKRPEDDAGGAWLGVFTQPLTDDFARYWNLPPDGGLIVSTVVPGSPAAVVGIRPGDVLTRFGDLPLHAKQDRDVVGFTKLVRDAGPGLAVSLGVLRDGKPLEVDVTLGARPRTSSDAQEHEDAYFGLVVREITRDIRIALNLEESLEGVIVRRITSGSIAQLGKLQPGVIILRFAGHPVANVEDFKAAAAKVMEEKPAEVVIFGRVGSANTFFRLDPRWQP